MFNAKSELSAALLADAGLVSMLGKIKTADKKNTAEPSIFVESPDVWDGLPAISYYEANNSQSEFADDVCISEEITMIVDIWSNGSTTAIFRKVDAIMQQLDYVRDFSADIPDKEVKHKTTRYIKTVEYDNEEEI